MSRRALFRGRRRLLLDLPKQWNVAVQDVPDEPVLQVDLQLRRSRAGASAFGRIPKAIRISPEVIVRERVSVEFAPVAHAGDELFFEGEVIDRVVHQVLNRLEELGRIHDIARQQMFVDALHQVEQDLVLVVDQCDAGAEVRPEPDRCGINGQEQRFRRAMRKRETARGMCVQSGSRLDGRYRFDATRSLDRIGSSQPELEALRLSQ
jgi:hypothetical protein